MLIYSPAFDIQHAMFRILRLLESMPKQSVDVDRVRILDFFILFPEKIEAICFPAELRKQRALFKVGYNPYRHLENPRRMLFDLEPFQLAALQCIAAYGLIDKDALRKSQVVRTTKSLPEHLAERIKQRNKDNRVLVDLLSVEFSRLPFFGDGGLKERSGLSEVRYDPA